MTTIIATYSKAEHSVTFLADRQASMGSQRSHELTKVWGGNYVAGAGAGYARSVQKLHLKLPKFDHARVQITEIADWIEKQDFDGGCFIVACPQGLYEIDSDGYFGKAQEFAATGSGSSYALGVLSTGGDAETAAEAATVLDSATGSTFDSFTLDLSKPKKPKPVKKSKKKKKGGKKK